MGCHVKTIFYVDGVQLKCYFVVNRLAGRWFKSKNVSGICQVPIFCAFFGHWLVGGGWWSNAGALQESPPTSRGQWALLLETRWYSRRMRRSLQEDGAALSDPQGRCSMPSWYDLFHVKKIRYRKYELQATNSKVQEIAPIFAFCKWMWLQLWAYLRAYLWDTSVIPGLLPTNPGFCTAQGLTQEPAGCCLIAAWFPSRLAQPMSALLQLATEVHKSQG